MRPTNGSDGAKSDVSSRTAGIIRRYVPIDTRDPHGAILRFYVGERYICVMKFFTDLERLWLDSQFSHTKCLCTSQMSEDPIVRKFQTKGIMWYLTVLGSLATSQREYVALHAFQNLQQQVNDCVFVAISTCCPVYHCLQLKFHCIICR